MTTSSCSPAHPEPGGSLFPHPGVGGVEGPGQVTRDQGALHLLMFLLQHVEHAAASLIVQVLPVRPGVEWIGAHHQ